MKRVRRQGALHEAVAEARESARARPLDRKKQRECIEQEVDDLEFEARRMLDPMVRPSWLRGEEGQ